MTGTEHLITEAAGRLFGELCTREVLEAAEAGAWPETLWAAIEESGFTGALAVGEADASAGLAGAAAILKSAGYFAAPVPLAETMLSAWVLSGAGLEVPGGPLTLAPVRATETLELVRDGAGTRLHGAAHGVPWAGRAARIVVLAQDGNDWCVTTVDPGAGQVEAGRSYAGEPRDTVRFRDVPLARGEVAGLCPARSLQRIRCMAALMRSVMMTGALERVLDLSTAYALERMQFGRPLAKFQVIQQNLVVLAGEAAAADMAAKAASAAAARDDFEITGAAAKIRTGEAAGRAASIAHQVHGAIGFTREHSLHHATRRLWSWRDEFGHESEWAVFLGARVAQAGADTLWHLVTEL